MGVARGLINWCDKKYAEAVHEDSDKKAFLSGFVEGFVGAAIVLYIPVTIGCYIWRIKAEKK